MNKQKLYILMLSLHGLVRGKEMELGRDADTGGQVTYVVELARALGRHPEVDRVELLTRLIEDPSVSDDYRMRVEPLGDNAQILRLPFGPKRYIRKELLWTHLDLLVDRCMVHLREQGRLPDLIHSHYADAGYVARQVSLMLGIPMMHTGHSLGRVKRQRLLDSGRKEQAIDRQFNFSQRIEAEEQTLAHAAFIVTSTHQEARDQYGLYESYDSKRAIVIPPGTDTTRFSPPEGRKLNGRIQEMVDRFLYEPHKPMILAICRPEERKNLKRLVAAYGESRELRYLSNLVIFAGNRDDIRGMEDESQRKVLSDLLFDIDRYDLWGLAAIPKRHAAEDVPEAYRYAVQRNGVFVNPALTEPFGLTLLEAAASGLPVVATNDGGPQDIIANCNNGLLVDPLNTEAIASALKLALGDRPQWRRWSRNGILGVKRHYTWDAHVGKYMKAVTRVLHRERKRRRRTMAHALREGQMPLPLVDNVLVSDIDNTLIGDPQGLIDLMHWLREHADVIAFAVATGRPLETTVKVLREHDVLAPDVWITSVGTEINYGKDLSPDEGWANHIRHLWRRDDVVTAMTGLPGVRMQSRENQRMFKISYNVDPEKMPSLDEMQTRLRSKGLRARLIYSHGAYLDVLPVRASKGQAIRYLAYKFGLPLKSFLVAGDSGNDAEMLIGDTLGVVVGNHSPELEFLKGREQVYFAQGPSARGILEGIERYGFAETGKPTGDRTS
jgi:sucrose-phosphate synthase